MRWLQQQWEAKAAASSVTCFYKCQLCEKTYSSRSSCTNHEVKVHNLYSNLKRRRNLTENQPKPYSCQMCKKCFTTRRYCTAHETYKHKLHLNVKRKSKNGTASSKKYHCQICGRSFSTRFNLTRHEVKIHELLDNVKDESPAKTNAYYCQICQKTFSTRSSCTRHEFSIHKMETNVCKKLTCAECDFSFQTTARFDKHVIEEHPDIKMMKENLMFDSQEDFEAWKLETSKNTAAKFCIKTQYKTTSGNVCIFECHRSGQFQSKSKGFRRVKTGGSNKIGYYCPARIKAQTYDTNEKLAIHVTFYSTHIGHECEVSRLGLTKPEKEELAKHMLSGLPIQSVLEKVSKNVDPTDKLALIKAQDLRNISASYGIDLNWTEDEDDVLNVDNWVHQMTESESNCILIYKPLGVVMKGFPDIQAGDFFLGFMTDVQENILEMHGNDMISIDTTESTNKYNVQLTSIVVKDITWQGFSVAFLWSNHQSEEVLRQFFMSIQKRVGKLQPNIFLSNDYPIYYTAWNSVFGPSNYYLLNDLHVKKIWLEAAITGPLEVKKITKRQNLIDALNKMTAELDETAFEYLHQAFLVKYLDDPETSSFAQFFLTNYSNRKEQWATCYRIETNINSIRSIQRWHKDFKYFDNLRGKRAGRLERVIYTVMDSMRVKLLDKLQSVSSEKLVTMLNLVNKIHLTAEQILQSVTVTLESENIWAVSSSNYTETFKVKRVETVSHKCCLKCVDCNACLHQFLCTCSDSSLKYIFCQHIHVVCMKNKSEHSIHLDKDCNLNMETISENKNMTNDAGKSEGPSNLREEARSVCLGILPVLEKCESGTQLKEIIHNIKVLESKCKKVTSEPVVVKCYPKNQKIKTVVQ